MYLESRNISKTFGEEDNRTYALRNVSFGIDKGQFVVILGPSGSGKSTLLNIIGGIENADSGTIVIDGDELDSFGDKKLTEYRRKHLGYVFQSYNLISNLTVRENVEVGAYLSEHPLGVDEMLTVLGMEKHSDKVPNQLSGGQQQRTAIGRAVVKNPDILLCDEPTGALDYHTSKDILQLLDDVNRKYNTTVIMVTHNEALAAMADRVLRLRDGEIVKDERNEERKSVMEIEW